MACADPLNTRIFASDFQFGEFHAILRGVFVKKIHNFSLFKFSVARLKQFVPFLFHAVLLSYTIPHIVHFISLR